LCTPKEVELKLDIILPTFNRQDLLERALRSLFEATIPAGLDVTVTVVDNNSKDGTRQVVESWQKKFDGRLQYLFEERQGKSHSLNTGIAATEGDLIGLIDDDEEIDVNWYVTVEEAFRDPTVDFIGGPCMPRWEIPPPAWLPRNYPGVIGWIDGGDKVLAYGGEYEGILMGGNAVLRRKLMETVGLYRTDLGPTGKRILLGDDQDMFERIMAAKARGFYLPNLIIYHHVPATRLKKRYHRRWCFWNGVSLSIIDRHRRAEVAYFAGVPRWLFRRAAQSAGGIATDLLRRDQKSAPMFSKELTLWEFAGFVYGKHVHR
jgi:glycosyltransferase involved in cell wall biosynthesis